MMPVSAAHSLRTIYLIVAVFLCLPYVDGLLDKCTVEYEVEPGPKLCLAPEKQFCKDFPKCQVTYSMSGSWMTKVDTDPDAAGCAKYCVQRHFEKCKEKCRCLSETLEVESNKCKCVVKKKISKKVFSGCLAACVSGRNDCLSGCNAATECPLSATTTVSYSKKFNGKCNPFCPA